MESYDIDVELAKHKHKLYDHPASTKRFKGEYNKHKKGVKFDSSTQEKYYKKKRGPDSESRDLPTTETVLEANELKLLQSAKDGDLITIKKILSEEIININCQDHLGATSSHYASLFGRLRCLNYLIDNAASVNIKDINGSTPLHHAAFRNYPKCLTLLLSHFGDVEAADIDGNTALHKAVYRGIRSFEILC